MTQIDFYILTDSSTRNIEYLTCQITEKALAQHKTVYIHANSTEQANRLDELLWKYKPESFLAHKNLLQAEIKDQHASESAICHNTKNENNATTSPFHYPIVIGMGEEIVVGYDQVLINLDANVPPFFSSFHRVAEMVSNLPDDKKQARLRYRFYKERGYPLNKHDIQ